MTTGGDDGRRGGGDPGGGGGDGAGGVGEGSGRGSGGEVDPLACLLPLMEAKGVTLSPEAFHRAVNLTYHRFESSYYDRAHREMWESLPPVVERVCGDLAEAGLSPPEGAALLDVGCGTGLATELLLRSPVGARFGSVHLLDTCPEMLQRCRWRSLGWAVEATFQEGTLEEVPAGGFDFIVASSLLHHIPDLGAFCGAVERAGRPGAVFFHLHDPNGDSADDPDLDRRVARLAEARAGSEAWARRRRRFSPLRLARRAVQKIVGREEPGLYDEINAALLEAGVVRKPLADEEFWSVTDIHELGLPYSHRDGISVARIGQLLPRHRLVSTHAYAYFGRLASTLPRRFRAEEAALAERRDPAGRKVAAAWVAGGG